MTCRRIFLIYSHFNGGHVFCSQCVRVPRPFLFKPSKEPKQNNIPILLYHHISVLPVHTTKAMRRWTISPQKFEDQMDWVADHGFHAVSMKIAINLVSQRQRCFAGTSDCFDL